MNRRILGSSAINNTRLVGLLIIGAEIFVDGRLRQNDSRCRAAAEAFAHDIDRSVVGADKGGRNPETESGAGYGIAMAFASERPLAELRTFFCGDAGAVVGDRNVRMSRSTADADRNHR